MEFGFTAKSRKHPGNECMCLCVYLLTALITRKTNTSFCNHEIVFLVQRTSNALIYCL